MLARKKQRKKESVTKTMLQNQFEFNPALQ